MKNINKIFIMVIATLSGFLFTACEIREMSVDEDYILQEPDTDVTKFIYPSSVTFNSTPYDQAQTVKFNGPSNSSWAIFNIPDYITVSPTSWTGDCELTITCNQNHSLTARTAMLSICEMTGSSATTSQITLRVRQEGSTIALSSLALTLDAIDGIDTVAIASSQSWNAETYLDEWLSMTTPQSSAYYHELTGEGNSLIILKAKDNETSQLRRITVNIHDDSDSEILTITQKPSPIIFDNAYIHSSTQESVTIEVRYSCFNSEREGYSSTYPSEYPITGMGVVYSETQDLNLENATVINYNPEESAPGYFNTTIPGLVQGSTYYIRGYITVEAKGISKTYYTETDYRYLHYGY